LKPTASQLLWIVDIHGFFVAVRAALLHGLRLVAGICAAVLLIVAGQVAFRLRDSGEAGQANAPQTPGAAALPER
jgi:DHA2 family multidrug resistance protein-like MFS transporter